MRRLPLALLVLAAPALAQEYGTPHRFKVEVGGEERKCALFVPAGLKEGESLPLLVAVPDTEGLAMMEIGQWELYCHKHRFAVLSVDTMTGRARGWLPTERLEMKRDVEAFMLAIEEAKALAPIDERAIALTGFSGGTYCAIWMGIRHPKPFIGLCARGAVFFPETVQFDPVERVEPDYDMPIFLYRGRLDITRAAKETELAYETLKKAGYTKVEYRVVDDIAHESAPEVCLEWFLQLLKESEKPRKAHREIAAEVAELKPDLEAKPGPASYGKLRRLVEKEAKAGIRGAAHEVLAGIEKEAEKAIAEALATADAGEFLEAVELLRKVEEAYRPLDVSKKAKDESRVLSKSDEYKAAEMLRKALDHDEAGREEKAFDLFEEIVAKYPETRAAAEARRRIG